MPELPEVETTVRGLRQPLKGRRVEAVQHLDWPNMLPNIAPGELARLLPGRRVADVQRRGKLLLLKFEDGSALILHRKMSGNLLLRAAGALPERHTHCVLRFDQDLELHFIDPRKFGRIYFFPSASALEAFLSARLGPEPLDGLSATELALLLRGRRGRVKPLLLDQRLLAGVGNLYADEALWLAGIHPARTARGLRPEEAHQLALALRQVLQEGIERRGTSFSTYMDALGERGENQDYLRVYGRAGLPCLRCGERIVRIVVAQRGTYICPRCQPLEPERG